MPPFFQNAHMDFNHLLPNAFAVVLVAFLISITWSMMAMVVKKDNNDKSRQVKILPGRRPIIGHLHLLSGRYQPHRLFTRLAEQGGPMFLMKLGSHWTLVISSCDLARECFTVNDRNFATRPIGFTHRVLGYDCAMFAFSPYGHYWREARKIATTSLLTQHKFELLKPMWGVEMGLHVKGLFRRWVENGRRALSLDMNQQFETIMFNIIMQMVAGKRYMGVDVPEADKEVARRFRSAAKAFNRFLGVTIAYDALPFFGWLDLKGDIKAMRKTHEEMDEIMQGWVDEHRCRRKNGPNAQISGNEGQDFIDALLSMEEEGSLKELHQDTNVVVKATALNIVIAGVENAAMTMVWALSLVIKHSQALKKAQAELDSHVGKERAIKESDLASLTYLQAVIKETQRLYPAAPLLVPHQAMEDCTVNGCHIARGTRLLVNAWMIQRDPQVWSDPHEFHPERFLQGTDVVKGQSFEIIPFGSGRRMCPGAGFSTQVMLLILARLLHAFDWMVDDEVGLDLDEGYGVSLCKLKPLQVMLRPRLPEDLYK